MLARANRITAKKDFDKIKEEGKLIQSESFSLSYIDRKDDGVPRFGIIVSTKISKDATIRNKVKRALREGVRQTLAYVKPGYDVVLLAKPISVRRYTNDIMAELRDLLGKSPLNK